MAQSQVKPPSEYLEAKDHGDYISAAPKCGTLITQVISAACTLAKLKAMPVELRWDHSCCRITCDTMESEVLEFFSGRQSIPIRREFREPLQVGKIDAPDCLGEFFKPGRTITEAIRDMRRHYELRLAEEMGRYAIFRKQHSESMAGHFARKEQLLHDKIAELRQLQVHWMARPGMTACGEDYPSIRKSDDPSRVNCERCRDVYAGRQENVQKAANALAADSQAVIVHAPRWHIGDNRQAIYNKTRCGAPAIRLNGKFSNIARDAEKVTCDACLQDIKASVSKTLREGTIGVAIEDSQPLPDGMCRVRVAIHPSAIPNGVEVTQMDQASREAIAAAENEKPYVCDACRPTKVNWYGPCGHQPPDEPKRINFREFI